MSIWSWLMIASSVVLIPSAVLLLTLDEKKYQKLMGILKPLAITSGIALILSFFIGGQVKASRESDSNKAELESLGFRVVDMNYTLEARVSLPGYPIGCRITLKSQDKNWYASVAGAKDGRPVIDAAEVSQRSAVKHWCGQPKK